MSLTIHLERRTWNLITNVLMQLALVQLPKLLHFNYK